MNARGVWGPIPAEALGLTLVHEHVLFDVSDYWQQPSEATRLARSEVPVTIDVLGEIRFDPFLLRDNLVHGDVDVAVSELGAFAARGGMTVVDATNVSMGRDPRALQRIAAARASASSWVVATTPRSASATRSGDDRSRT